MFRPTKVIRKFLDDNDFEANFDVKELARKLLTAFNSELCGERQKWHKVSMEASSNVYKEHKGELAELRRESRAKILDIFISIAEALTYRDTKAYVYKASIKAMKALDKNNNVGIRPS